MTVNHDLQPVDDPYEHADLPDLPDLADLADVPEDEWAEIGDTVNADAASEGNDQPPLYFPNVEVFVSELLAPTYRRSLDGRHRTWCPQWWRHAEASPASKHRGEPGNTSASTQPPASASGYATTPTPTWPCS